MSLSFASAVGNFWNRIGKIALVLKQVRSYQNSQLTNLTDTTNGVVAQFNGESDIQAIAGDNYIAALGAPVSVCQNMQAMAEQTVNRMIFRDNPRLLQTLQTLDTIDSLLELIRQMKVAGATILQMTITATNSVGASGGSFTGNGNGVINVSVKRPLDGRTLENAFAETLLFQCIADSYTGGATAGAETISCVGAGAQTDFFAFNWPLGSGAKATLSAIDGDGNNVRGNLLTNSNFNTWTSNVPNSFTLTVGTAGTDIVQNGSITYGSSLNSLQLVGNGSTIIELRQSIPAANIANNTQYSVAIYLRRDSTAAAQGVLTIDLIDGNGTVIGDNNAAGAVPNSFTVDLTALSTNFTPYVGTFRTPAITPVSPVSIRLRTTTALTNGRNVYAAKLSMGLMQQIYVSGPFAAVHAGSLNFAASDYATSVITNSRGSGGVLDTFQTAMARLFPLVMQQELLIPSASSPSIPDSLIS